MIYFKNKAYLIKYILKDAAYYVGMLLAIACAARFL
jgi:hypothetical protein